MSCLERGVTRGACGVTCGAWGARACADDAYEGVDLPDSVVDILVNLRNYLQEKCEPPVYVSDRRFMKAVNLLQVAAHADGRDEVCHARLHESKGGRERGGGHQRDREGGGVCDRASVGWSNGQTESYCPKSSCDIHM
jgi:hypothetical protein